MKPQPPSLSSSLATSMKLKTLIQNFIFSHIYRVTRAITKAKSIFIEFLKELNVNNIRFLESLILKKSKNKNKFGSFRLYYNWSSSHVVPMTYDHHVYCDYTWASEVAPESQLSGYLDWLEEKSNSSSINVEEINEIDRLADKFIENCHEKFRIEKQESYRRFQEMMARSV